MWLCSSFQLVYEIWKVRNNQRFGNKAPSLVDIISSAKAKIQLKCSICPGFVSNADGHVLSLLGIKPHLRKAPHVTSCTWRPPSSLWIKVNTNGCSNGNPGAGACSVVKDDTANKGSDFMEQRNRLKDKGYEKRKQRLGLVGMVETIRKFDEDEVVNEAGVERDVGLLLMVRPAFVSIIDDVKPERDEEECYVAPKFDKEVVSGKGDTTEVQRTTMVVRLMCLIPRAAFATIIDVDEQVVDEGVEVPTELQITEEETQNSKGVAID
ncbi:hypothetical protein LWI29_006215 [Acer saccharum]|uniref:Uncharacterized protein n=1 Tax=Acer saccharum TaxID=4024 RepID=A0AA39RPC1_ACESA|nr:hypothetical protein LWI29_006215 [Acer saccharum]